MFKFLDLGSPGDGELSLEVIRYAHADPMFDWPPSYDIELRVAGATVGRMNLRADTTPAVEKYGGHLGYEVDGPHRGHRYAERAVRLLIPFMRRHGFEEIWITCNPDNAGSKRTCERLGAEYVNTVQVPPENTMYGPNDREKCRYRLRLT